MAIDTENKRRSALLGSVLPKPDSLMNDGDRKHVAWLYRGSLELAVTGEGLEYRLLPNRLHYSVSGRLHHQVGGRLHYLLDGD